MHNPAFCSASTAKQRYRQDLNIKGMSSIAVPLIIVPLELGMHDIEVKAAVRGQFVADGVKKKLKVVVRNKSASPMVLRENVAGAMKLLLFSLYIVLTPISFPSLETFVQLC